MTCRHVLNVIDAGPFVDLLPEQLDATRAHARDCRECSLALASSASLTAALAAMPVAVPPSQMTEAVMARIAQIEQARPRARVVVRPERAVASGSPDWWAWAAAAGAAAVTFAIVPLIATGSALADGSFSGSPPGPVPMPATMTRTLAIAASLALYLVGLLGPLGRGGRRSPT